MGSALVVAVVKYGLLALLWVFIIAAVRTMRADLSGRAAVHRSPDGEQDRARRRARSRRRASAAGWS